MKKTASKLLIFALAIALMVSLFPAAALAAEPDFKIVYPSADETTIAPGRDFYVIGTASTTQLADKNITIELFREGETTPVRSLTHKDTYSAAYDKAVPALDNQYDDGMLPSDVCMPDLIYDTVVDGSEKDGNVKIAVTDNNFSALILGGKNNDGLTSQGEELTAGNYYIKVTLASGDFITKDIVIGDTESKVISRYSPTDHYAGVTAFASANNMRMYVDPFPGYWSPNGVIYYKGNPLDGSVFLESLSRWRYADGLEYEKGKVNLFLYNINATCASESVEIAALQRTNRVDTDMNCYYYDLGEPSLVNDSKTLTGTLTKMDDKDKLQFSRAQISTATTTDNQFALYKNYTDEIDKNVTDGVAADKGETVSIFGTVAPIQNTAAQITDDGKNGYTTANHISSIRYTFYKGTVQAYKTVRSVGLQREYTQGKVSTSIYEFKHAFKLADDLASGSFTVVAEALDKDGNYIENGSETFKLVVTASPTATPTSTKTPSPTSTNPKTGDQRTDSVFWIMLAVIAVCAACVVIWKLRRGAKNN